MNDKRQRELLLIKGDKARFEVDLFHQFLRDEINIEDFKSAVSPKGNLKLLSTQSDKSTPV